MPLPVVLFPFTHHIIPPSGFKSPFLNVPSTPSTIPLISPPWTPQSPLTTLPTFHPTPSDGATSCILTPHNSYITLIPSSHTSPLNQAPLSPLSKKRLSYPFLAPPLEVNEPILLSMIRTALVLNLDPRGTVVHDVPRCSIVPAPEICTF